MASAFCTSIIALSCFRLTDLSQTWVFLFLGKENARKFVDLNEGETFKFKKAGKAWRDPLHTVTPCTIAYATFIVSVSPLSFRCMIDIVFHSSFAILFLLQTTAALMKAVLSNRMCLMRLLRFLKTRSISMNLL